MASCEGAERQGAGPKKGAGKTSQEKSEEIYQYEPYRWWIHNIFFQHNVNYSETFSDATSDTLRKCMVLVLRL